MNSAHSYILPQVQEFYYIPSKCITIPRNNTGDYNEILNIRGVSLFKKILFDVKNDKFKDTFTHYQIQQSPSGMWIPNILSNHYNDEDMIMLNTLENIIIVGLTDKLFNDNKEKKYSERKSINTSIILFYTNEWCYTNNGSLYKLGKKYDCFTDLKDEKIDLE